MGVLFGFKFMIWILLILAAIAWIVLNSNSEALSWKTMLKVPMNLYFWNCLAIICKL